MICQYTCTAMSHYLQVLYKLEVILYSFFCPVCQGNIRKTMRKIGQTDIFSPGVSVLSCTQFLKCTEEWELTICCIPTIHHRKYHWHVLKPFHQIFWTGWYFLRDQSNHVYLFNNKRVHFFATSGMWKEYISLSYSRKKQLDASWLPFLKNVL